MISPMNSAELQDFVDNRMRMSHVYQPLLIRCLLDAGGQATLRQLAIEDDVIDTDSVQQSGCTPTPNLTPILDLQSTVPQRH